MKTAGLWFPVILCGTALFVISQDSQVTGLFPWVPAHTKELVGHLGLFSIIGLFLARYLYGMGVNWFTTLVLTANLVAVLGLYDEFHQSFVDNRSVQLYDILMDLAGGTAGALVYIGYAAVRWLVVKSARYREVRLDLLVRHAAVALTVFVFILVPAAICSVLVRDYVRALALEGPVSAQRVLDSYLHPKAPGVTTNTIAPAVSAGPTLSGARVDQAPVSTESLNQFALVAEMLLKAKENKSTSSVMPAAATAGPQSGEPPRAVADPVPSR